MSSLDPLLPVLPHSDSIFSNVDDWILPPSSGLNY